MGRADAAIRRRDYAAARAHLVFGLELMFRPHVDRAGPLGLSLVTSLTSLFVQVVEAQGLLADARDPLQRALDAFNIAEALAPVRGKPLLDWMQWALALQSELAAGGSGAPLEKVWR